MKRAARRSRRSHSPARTGGGLAARPASRPYAVRKTIFELPPLELECMKALWGQEESSVRQIRERLAAVRRPLAYTTVETIMDRLTRKGAVVRRKVGKAHRYTVIYQKEDARVQAVTALAEHFFGGSRSALRAYLEGRVPLSGRRLVSPPAARRDSGLSQRPAAAAHTRPATSPRAEKAGSSLDTTLL